MQPQRPTPYHIRTMQTPPDPQAGRQMGVWAATAVVTGEAISLGIFLTPAAMAKSLGSPALLGAVWCGMAVMTLAGALCFTELAIRNPHDGGEYLYLRRGFGRHVAFLYGWMAAVVMYPGVAAALCVGTVPYLQTLLPIPAGLVPVLPALILLALGALNYFGTRLSSGVMTTLNWLKVPVLVGLVGWALASGHASLANLAPLTARRAGSDPLIGAIAGAAISAFFCFGGWWEAGKIAGEVRNPIANPSHRLYRRRADRDRPLSARKPGLRFRRSHAADPEQHRLCRAVRPGAVRLGGRTRALRLRGAQRIWEGSWCSAWPFHALPMHWPAPNPATAPPDHWPSLPASTRGSALPPTAFCSKPEWPCWSCTLGAFDRILAFIIFSAVVFLALTVATLFRAITPVRRWWFPVAPIVFIAGSGILALMLLLHGLGPSLLGAAVVLAGLPVRWLLVRKHTALFRPRRGSGLYL